MAAISRSHLALITWLFMTALPASSPSADGQTAAAEPEATACPSMMQKTMTGSRALLEQEADELRGRLESQEARLQAAEQHLQASDRRIADLEALVRSLVAGGAGPGSLVAQAGAGSAAAAAAAAPSSATSAGLAPRANGTLEPSTAVDQRSLLSKRAERGILSDVKKLIKKAVDGVKKTVDDVGDGLKEVRTTTTAIQKAIQPATIWGQVKPLMASTIKPFEKKVQRAFNTIKNYAKKGINFFTDLYAKYLKPIINHVGGCAKGAGNAANFIFCMMEPVVNTVMNFLLPAGDVAQEVPFPDETVEGVWDFELGSYVKTSKCADCNGDDPRDTAPSACRDEEKEVGLGTMKLKICDAPFGMDKSKSIQTEIVDSLWTCAKKASIFRPGSVWANVSETLTSARMSLFSAEEVTAETLDHARHLQAIVTDSPDTSVAQALVSQIKQTVDVAVDNCVAAKDASMVLLAALGKVLEKYHEVPGKFALMMQKAGSCHEDILTAHDLVSQAESSNISALAEAMAATNLTSKLQEIKGGMQAMMAILGEHTASMSGSMKDSLEELMRSVAVPSWQELASLPLNCAIGKSSYMKAYISFHGNSPITGMGELFRMSLHQRGGFRFAWRNFKSLNKGFVVNSVAYTWEQLRQNTSDAGGVTTEFCFILYCLSVKFRLRQDFGDVLGIPLPSDMRIDLGGDVYFFSFEVTYFDLTLKRIGIPVELSVPVHKVFPEMTVPFLMSIPASATPPAMPAIQTQETELTDEADQVLASMQAQEGVATAAEDGTLEVAEITGDEDNTLSQVGEASGDLEPDFTDADLTEAGA